MVALKEGVGGGFDGWDQLNLAFVVMHIIAIL